jgi:hypothetical protein
LSNDFGHFSTDGALGAALAQIPAGPSVDQV